MSDPQNPDGLSLAPLDADTIPNANQSHHCPSCNKIFTGVFCAGCGQKNDDMRRSILSLFIEAFGSLTAFENRIWRTWGALLFKPGKVAREYSNGRRTHWSSPVRIYLAMSLILFGFINVTQTHLFSLDVQLLPKDGIERPIAELAVEDLTLKPSVHFFERQSDVKLRNKNRDFAALNTFLKSEITLDALLDTDTESPSDITFDGLTVSIETWRLLFIDFIKNPAQINQVLNIWLPRIMFLMMPFTMLIGALFIRGQENALLYDHLVHAAYIHAVAFLFLFVGIGVSRLFPALNIAAPLFALLALYLPFSLRRMFERSWPKTIWTSYGVAAIYLFIMGLILISILTYAIKLDLEVML